VSDYDEALFFLRGDVCCMGLVLFFMKWGEGGGEEDKCLVY